MLGATSSARIATLVKDVVTETLAGGMTEIRMSDRVLDGGARAAELPVRRGLREHDRDRRVQEGDRHPERACGRRSASVPTSSSTRATIESEGLDAATRDFIAGMTDRYAVRLFEQLFIPKPWAID